MIAKKIIDPKGRVQKYSDKWIMLLIKGCPQKGLGVEMLLKSELSAMVARERKCPDDP